jgi:hypothetical protein
LPEPDSPLPLDPAELGFEWWRDSSWHETIGHARDWLSLSLVNDEAKEAIQAFLDKKS